MLKAETLQTELEKIERLQQRWMIGATPVIDDLPASWQPLLQGQSGERLAVLALALAASQRHFLQCPQPAGALHRREDLPSLSLPPLPDPLRPLFRRCLAALGKRPGLSTQHLLALLAARGHCAHPADWMPDSNDDQLPAIYWPWSRWLAESAPIEAVAVSVSEDNWDEFYPAERLHLLRRMRLTDAAAARAVIEACARREPAEKRLKIIATLATELGPADSDYLVTLLRDRSQKVAQLATRLLARLGADESIAPQGGDDNVATELAQTFELKKTGLLKQHLKLLPLELKSNKRRALRCEQLKAVSFGAFATALSLSQKELAAYWRFDENRAQENQSLVEMAANTAGDEHIEVLLDNALDQLDGHEIIPEILHSLLPRLEDSARVNLLYRFLRHKTLEFKLSDCLQYLDEPLDEIDWPRFSGTRAWLELTELLKQDIGENGYVANSRVSCELAAAGLLLPQSVATHCLDALLALGAPPADPALDPLRLNVQLTRAG